MFKYHLKVEIFMMNLYPFFIGIINYILTINLTNLFYFVLSSLVLYGVFKLILRIIDYIIFKKIIDGTFELIFEDEDVEDFGNPSDKQDNQNRSHKKEAEVERINQQEQDLDIASKQQQKGPKVVGIKVPEVVGKWTAKIVQQWVEKHRNLNPQDLQKGYWQAINSAQMQTRGMQNQGNGRG